MTACHPVDKLPFLYGLLVSLKSCHLDIPILPLDFWESAFLVHIPMDEQIQLRTNIRTKALA